MTRTAPGGGNNTCDSRRRTSSGMVTPTKKANTWRVSFPIRETDLERVEVVAYFRVDAAGHVRIYYHCHNLLTREVATGPWTEEQSYRKPLSPQVSCLLQANCMTEMWKYLDPVVS